MSDWDSYVVPTILVDTGDGKKRSVRGLGLDDFGALLASNIDAMMDIAALYIQTQQDVTAKTNATDLLVVVMKDFPNFVSEVISIATDTPALRTMRLAAGLQLQVLLATYKLTVEDAGGLGNLSAMLQSAVRAAVAGRGEASQKLQEALSPFSTSDAGKTRTS